MYLIFITINNEIKLAKIELPDIHLFSPDFVQILMLSEVEEILLSTVPLPTSLLGNISGNASASHDSTQPKKLSSSMTISGFTCDMSVQNVNPFRGQTFF